MPPTPIDLPIPMDDALRMIVQAHPAIRLLMPPDGPNDAFALTDIGPEHYTITEQLHGGTRAMRAEPASPAALQGIAAWMTSKVRERHEASLRPLRAIAASVRVERSPLGRAVVLRRDGDDPSPFIVADFGGTPASASNLAVGRASALRAKLCMIFAPPVSHEDLLAVLREASDADALI